MNNQTDDDVPTSSQSEKDILASCVGLMGMVYEDMLDYMDDVLSLQNAGLFFLYHYLVLLSLVLNMLF